MKLETLKESAIIATSLVLMLTCIGGLVFSILSSKKEQETLEAIEEGAPGTRFTCTVEEVSKVTLLPARGMDSFSAKVLTEPCGQLSLEPIRGQGAVHMDIYRELTVGQTYEFALDEDKTIYKVTGPIAPVEK